MVFAIRATRRSADRLLPMIPEPTTAATRMPVPRNSANTALYFMLALTR
jgi:phage terminase large subunit-like protein